jgi:hypothetical protein
MRTMKNPGSPRSGARTRCGWPDRAHPCRTCAGNRYCGGEAVVLPLEFALTLPQTAQAIGVSVGWRAACAGALPTCQGRGQTQAAAWWQTQREFRAARGSGVSRALFRAGEGGRRVDRDFQTTSGRPVACHRPITCYTATAGGSSPPDKRHP